jgi:hypothetical protein
MSRSKELSYLLGSIVTPTVGFEFYSALMDWVQSCGVTMGIPARRFREVESPRRDEERPQNNRLHKDLVKESGSALSEKTCQINLAP